MQLNLAKIVAKNVPPRLEEGLDRVVRGEKLAVLTTDSVGYYLQLTKYWNVDYDRPRFHLSTKCYMTTNVGWITPKHTYYADTLKTDIQWMVDTGVTKQMEQKFVHQMREKFLVENPPKKKVVGWNRWKVEERAMTLDHLGYANKLLTTGWLIAFIVFLLECCLNKVRTACARCKETRFRHHGILPAGCGGVDGDDTLL